MIPRSKRLEAVTDGIPHNRAIATMPAFHPVLAEKFKPFHVVLETVAQAKKRMGLSLLAAVVAVLFTATALAQTDPAEQAVIEIVRLQHRSPSVIREAISPHLDSRGAISQMDNNLIISTSRANLAELQALITTLDIPRRQMRISVDFSYEESAADQDSADGRVVDVISTSEPQDNSRQSIVISEGEHAYFSTLNDVPRLSITATDNGLLLTEDQQQSGQSIGLSAELRDNEVLVRIATAQSQADATAAELQSRIVNTSIMLGFDEWFVINEEPVDDDSDSVIATTSSPADAIAIKVEIMR